MASTCKCSTGKKTKTQKHCQLHSLSLKGLFFNCEYKTKTHINLCPVVDLDTKVVRNIYPHYNNDGKPHMPAFTLQVDDSYFSLYENKFILDHQRKVQSSEDCELSSNWEPKPYNELRNCSVCDTKYKDYHAHINEPKHKMKIGQSKFNKYIEEICQLVQTQNKQKSAQNSHDSNGLGHGLGSQTGKFQNDVLEGFK